MRTVPAQGWVNDEYMPVPGGALPCPAGGAPAGPPRPPWPRRRPVRWPPVGAAGRYGGAGMPGAGERGVAATRAAGGDRG
jgi:hypothetical protein